ncbi:MAG TPA: MmoB/DmpM family protein [Kofleriaceae bacterium]|nr:MmoB/DmpM family protein [Kofleriaceae bacterium]
MAFREVARVDEHWPGDLRGVVVDGRKVVLVRVGEAICAYEDRCPHLGVPLSQGTVSRGILRCRAHHHEYDARTGAGVNPRGEALVRFPVKHEGDHILVDVDVAGGPAAARAPAADDLVGPVLIAGEVGAAIVAALRAQNPGLTVHDRGAYLRVLVAGRCVLGRAAVERALGRPVRLRAELEQVMPSFKGRLALSDDEATWSAAGR